MKQTSIGKLVKMAGHLDESGQQEAASEIDRMLRSPAPEQAGDEDKANKEALAWVNRLLQQIALQYGTEIAALIRMHTRLIYDREIFIADQPEDSTLEARQAWARDHVERGQLYSDAVLALAEMLQDAETEDPEAVAMKLLETMGIEQKPIPTIPPDEKSEEEEDEGEFGLGGEWWRSSSSDRLLKVANQLDNKGEYKAANQVDSVIRTVYAFTRRDIFDFYALHALDRDHPDYGTIASMLYNQFMPEIEKMVTSRQSSEGDWFTSGEGGKWYTKIPAQLAEIKREPDKGTQVDRLMQLTHHGGRIAEYMDPTRGGDMRLKWLNDALDRIFLADSPLDYISELSPKIRRDLYRELRELRKDLSHIPKKDQFAQWILMHLERDLRPTQIELQGNKIVGERDVKIHCIKDEKGEKGGKRYSRRKLKGLPFEVTIVSPTDLRIKWRTKKESKIASVLCSGEIEMTDRTARWVYNEDIGWAAEGDVEYHRSIRQRSNPNYYIAKPDLAQSMMIV